MGILELFLTAIGLSADAFAISLCKGLTMKRLKIKEALIIAGSFGIAQSLMPLIGFLGASLFKGYIESFDHYLAFVLLGVIGGKMIFDSIKKKNSDDNQLNGTDLKELIMLAIATSIDALAVGITFATLNVNIAYAMLVIGVITFTVCFIGVGIGCRFGAKLKTASGIVGGSVLILIGIKILLEHLGMSML